MLIKKCSLCGGRLADNRCVLCGLDHSIYEREISRQSSYTQTVSSENSNNQVQAPGVRQTPKRPPKPKKEKVKRNFLSIWIVIIVVVLVVALPVLVGIGREIINDIFTGADEEYYLNDYNDYDNDDDMLEDIYGDYDPYGSVTREISDDGTAMEVVLGNGVYRVGVHIPEGIYRVDLIEGTGNIEIEDYENRIYHYVTFGTEEEYDEVTGDDDIRLYNGADLKVGNGVILRFTTENAQTLEQETRENPLSEPVSLEAGTYTSGNDTIPQGIYDITALNLAEDEYGYSYIVLEYPNGFYEYLWVDSSDYAPVSDEYADTAVKNIVIPDGTEVTVEYGSIILTPSEGYYDVDYTEYTSE